MVFEDTSVKKVWKFSYKEWDTELLEGTFVASQDEIDWITGQLIHFSDTGKGLDVVIRIEADQFQVIYEDDAFVKQFSKAIGTSGTSSFAHLNDDQAADYDAEFGDTEVDGVLTENREETKCDEFKDEDSRVITYAISDDIIYDEVEYAEDEEAMAAFLALFEIIQPERNLIHMAGPVERFGNGVTNGMIVIKRKSDGQLFGYAYEIVKGSDMYCYSNGIKHGLSDDAYVWLPVKPFTITGYTF